MENVKKLLDEICGIVADLQKRVSELEKKKRSKGFVPPTVEEVAAYCKERGNGIDPQYFVDSNQTKGWLVGKNQTPAKCWKSMVRTWEHTAKQKGGGNDRLQGAGGGRQFRSAGERKTDIAREARSASLAKLGLCGNGPGLAANLHNGPGDAPKLRGASDLAGAVDKQTCLPPPVETRKDD